jgi:hypothetical protein
MSIKCSAIVLFATYILLSEAVAYQNPATPPSTRSSEKSDARDAILVKSIEALSTRLDAKIEKAKAEYENRQREMADYSTCNEVLLTTETNEAVEVQTLRKQMIELTLALDQKRTEYELINEAKPETLEISAETQEQLAKDPKLANLQERISLVEEAIAEATARAGGKQSDSDVRAAQAKRDFLDDRLHQESAARLLALQSRRIERGRTDYLIAQESSLRLKERLMSMEDQLRERDIKRFNLRRIQEECERAKKSYEDLVDQRRAIERLPLLISLVADMRHSDLVKASGLDVALTFNLNDPRRGPELTVRFDKDSLPVKP